MGKRSNKPRRKNDLYRTPAEAIAPLIPHLKPRFRFAEPCAANGQMVDALRRSGGRLTEALDIMPGRGDVARGDALTWRMSDRPGRAADYIITNPPWTRAILHPLIEHLSDQRPTWLLFDADWIHTRQAGPYLWRLRRVVSVGRVKWLPGTKMTGKDNAAWHLLDAKGTGPAEFFGRAA